MVPDIERVDLWLREICRRVAAGYRRRFGNKLEILGRDLDAEASAADHDAPDAGAGSEHREQLALVAGHSIAWTRSRAICWRCTTSASCR